MARPYYDYRVMNPDIAGERPAIVVGSLLGEYPFGSRRADIERSIEERRDLVAKEKKEEEKRRLDDTYLFIASGIGLSVDYVKHLAKLMPISTLILLRSLHTAFAAPSNNDEKKKLREVDERLGINEETATREDKDPAEDDVNPEPKPATILILAPIAAGWRMLSVLAQNLALQAGRGMRRLTTGGLRAMHAATNPVAALLIAAPKPAPASAPELYSA